MPRLNFAGLAQLAVPLVSLGIGIGLAPAAMAGTMGGAPAVPMPQAIARTRGAAEAVLNKAGTNSCLQGKLTNALLELSSSCEASGGKTPLCALADKAVVTTGWTMPYMEATSRQVLELSAPTTAAQP